MKNLITIFLFFLILLIGLISIENSALSFNEDTFYTAQIDSYEWIPPERVYSIESAEYRAMGDSFVANVSAYSSSEDQTDSSPFFSADQQHVFKGLIACSRNFDFGTYFLINGKLYYCGDRFNLRFEKQRNKDGMYHLDIWFSDRNSAIEFGRQYLIATPLKKI